MNITKIMIWVIVNLVLALSLMKFVMFALSAPSTIQNVLGLFSLVLIPLGVKLNDKIIEKGWLD